MSRRWIGWTALVILVLLAPPAAEAQSRNSAEVVRALLTLDEEDLEGNSWTHRDLRGRVVLVDFWATWCAPCLRELPYLKEARERFGDKFEVIGVSLDTFSRRELRSWMARQGVDWPQIHATGGYDDPLAVEFGIDRLPINFLLDTSGRLRAVNVRGEALFNAVEELIEPAAKPSSD